MRLKSVGIKGFRPFKDEVVIPIDDLTVFIGKNDIGKSSILEALGVFFEGDGAKIEARDCNIYSANNVVEIACEFDNLPDQVVLDVDAPTSLANEYLLTQQGTLRIRKRFDLNGSKPKIDIFICAYHPTADGYQDLLSLTNTQLKERMRKLRVSEEGVDLRVNHVLRRAIWSSSPNLRMGEVEIPVNKEDAKKIWEQISKLLPTYALFKSDRPSQDTDSEVQDPMKLAINAAIAEVQTELDRITEIVKQKAEEIARNTHEQLKRIDPKLASELHPDFRSDPKWSGVFSLTLNTDNGIPLNKRGSGVRRMVLLSFFRAEAERRRSEQSRYSLIYAIEEPETSQHPNNQRLLLEALRELSEEDGCQVLLTTHSPGFANMLPLESLRYIDRSADGTIIIQYGEEQVYQNIADSLGVLPDTRVKVLLCVEGPTDVENLKALSRVLHQENPTLPDLTTDSRVAFVVLGGGTLQHWVNQHYLAGLGRLEVHIYDGDVAKYQTSCEKVNKRNDGSWAVQTQKRELENYLHPEAIHQAFKIVVSFGDDDDVPAIVGKEKNWNIENAKKKLSAHAFPCMTIEMLRERDPKDEVKGWMERLARML
ncbi:MAG: ATP-binding protein [Chloroflexota bacterium]